MIVPPGFKSLPLPIGQLSLAAVLKCGQSFRWTACPLTNVGSEDQKGDGASVEPTHEYRLALKDRVVCLRQNEDSLFFRSVFPVSKQGVLNASARSKKTQKLEKSVKIEVEELETAMDREEETLKWLKDYFQLEVDLVKLYSAWADRDVIFRDTVKERFAGIRMLRQDPWENVVSFICSSNNNIGRITKMVQSLCTEFSPALCTLADDSGNTHTYHPFPSPKILSHESVAPKLRELGFGYRAEYVQRTAEMLCAEHEDPEAWLLSLREKSEGEAKEELLKLCGVGPKVADCVLLMSLDKRNVVPVDTHVHQIALKHYGLRGTPQGKGGKVPMTPKIYEAVSNKLVETWGDYAGWAHSVLFTADLRAFADYGLTPSSTPTGTPNKKSGMETSPTKVPLLDTPSVSVPPTPSESGSDYFGTPILDTPRRRKTTQSVIPTVETPRKRKVQSGSPSKLKRVRTE